MPFMSWDPDRSEWKRIKKTLPPDLPLEALEDLARQIGWQRANRDHFSSFGSATEMQARAAAIHRHASELARLLSEEPDHGHSLFERAMGARLNRIDEPSPELRTFLVD